MFTKSQLDKMIGTLTSKISKTQNFIYRDELSSKKQNLPKKLQRSPKIIACRDESMDDYFSDLKQPLLHSQSCNKDTGDNDQEISCCKRLSTNITNNNNTNNCNMRVKVLMTKKEAAMLLSKCKEKGTLEFKDVINELVKLPPPRINVESATATATATTTATITTCLDNGRALATIPEED